MVRHVCRVGTYQVAASSGRVPGFHMAPILLLQGKNTSSSRDAVTNELGQAEPETRGDFALVTEGYSERPHHSERLHHSNQPYKQYSTTIMQLTSRKGNGSTGYHKGEAGVILCTGCCIFFGATSVASCNIQFFLCTTFLCRLDKYRCGREMTGALAIRFLEDNNSHGMRT